jgi:riboflavin kinase/FMN adenylyltransferase
VKLIHLNETAIDDLLGGRVDGRHPDTAPCALSLGSFDGLHLGHRRLIAAVRGAQARLGLPVSALFTFRRHPRQLLDPDGAPALLTPWRERLALLDGLGLELLVAADFCPALARTPYDDFVRRFLVGHLGLRHMVAGHDVHLGAGRGGNAVTLAALGPVLGYGFEEVPALEVDGRVVSSSAIRGCLAAGDVADAAVLLGRPYALWGEVGPGDGRGDTIGFPTANITPCEAQKLLPAPGVYAVRVLVPADLAARGAAWGADPVTLAALPFAAAADEFVVGPATAWRSLPGMLNYGRAPTFHAGGRARLRVETHLFDFAGDLRGRSVRVDWIARLRDERRFPGVAALVAQLAHDREAALRALAG